MRSPSRTPTGWAPRVAVDGATHPPVHGDAIRLAGEGVARGGEADGVGFDEFPSLAEEREDGVRVALLELADEVHGVPKLRGRRPRRG